MPTLVFYRMAYRRKKFLDVYLCAKFIFFHFDVSASRQTLRNDVSESRQSRRDDVSASRENQFGHLAGASLPDPDVLR